MNNSKIYFRITAVINILFWLTIYLGYFAFSYQDIVYGPIAKEFGISFVGSLDQILHLSRLILALAIFISFFWGGWLIFRLGAKDRLTWLGIILELISVFLTWLVNFHWSLCWHGFCVHPNSFNSIVF